MTIIEELLPWT